MAAEVVGTAFVRIRALTTGLAKDIERGIDKGARDADVDSSGAIVGDKFAKSAGEKIKAGIEDAVSDTTKNIDKKVDVDGGRRTGDRLGESIKSGLSRSLDGFGNRVSKLFGIDEASGRKAGSSYGQGLRGSLIKAAALFAPAIFGAGSLILQYVVALVAQIGLLAQATAGAGLAMGGAFGVGLAALLPLVLAFKTATPRLKKFTDQAKKVGKAWGEVGAATQETLLPGLSKALDYSKALIPIFRAWGREVGRVVGTHAEFLAAVLASEEGQRRMRSILQQSTPVLETMARITLRLGDVFSRLFEAVLPITLQFVEAIEQMVARWQEALAVTSADGTLAATLQDWYDKASLVGGALADLWGAMWNILKVGGDSAVPFFENFATWAEEFNAWTASAVGQNKLKQIFDDALEVAHELNGLVVDISRAIGGAVFEPGGNEGIIGFITMLREDLVPFLEDTILRLRDEVGPALGEFVQSFGDLLTTMSDSGALSVALLTLSSIFDTLTAILNIPGMDRVIGLIIGIGTAFALIPGKQVLPILRGLATLIGFLARGVMLLAGGSLSTAVGIVLAIVGAAALLVIHWDKVKAAFRATVRFLKDPMKRLERLGELLGDLAGWIKEKLGEAWDDALEAIGDFVSNAGEWIGDLVSDIIDGLADLGSLLVGSFRDAFVSLVTALPRMIGDVLYFFASLPFRIGFGLAELGLMLVAYFTLGIAHLVNWLVKTGIPRIVKFFSELPGNIIDALSSLKDLLVELVTGAISGVTNFLTTNIPKVVQFFLDLPGKVWTALKELWPKISERFSEAFTGVKNAISTFITETLPNFGEDMLSAGQNLIGKLVEGLGKAISGTTDIAKDIVNGIIDFINTQVIERINDLLEFDFKVRGIGFSVDPPDINPIPKLKANGDIFRRATNIIAGEAGPEVLIPLTRPRRALELFEKSGLAAVLAQARRSNSRSGALTLSPSRSGGDTIINQTFNEKVDPKHMATELAWILS